MAFNRFPTPLGELVPWWRLRRRPLLFWAGAGALSLLTGIVMAGVIGRAEEQAARFGALRPVLVTTDKIPAGGALGPDNTEVRSYPSAFVPEGVLDSPIEGAIAAVDLEKGEPVPKARLSPRGLSPTAAMIPPGGRAIAVPAGVGTLPLVQGDRVDVLATIGTTEAVLAPSAPSSNSDGSSSDDSRSDGSSSAASRSVEASPPTFRIAADAVVLALGDDGVTIALTSDEAERVAYALTAGVVTLILNGA